MRGVRTGTAVTARTTGVKEIPYVGAGTTGGLTSGTELTIAIEERVAKRFPAGTGITTV